MRLTDNDRKLWFITYGPSDSQIWAFHFNTGNPEDTQTYRNHLWISLLGWVVFIPLPNLVSPFKKKIFPTSWDAATIERLGRNWYYEWANRCYGVSLSDEGFFQLFYGKQSYDGSDDKRKSWFLPWTQWRFIHEKLFHYDGRFHACLSNEVENRLTFEQRKEIRSGMRKLAVDVVDVDGECIQAYLHIVERKWERGEKPFTWLKYFYKPLVTRCVEIEFSNPVGARKDSWKGGLMGTSTTLSEGESAYDAFTRYIQTDRSRDSLHGIRIIGPVDPLHNQP